MEAATEQKIVATIVPEGQRMNFMPKHFGGVASLILAESMLYGVMGKLDPTYKGGMWEFVELSNGGMFMYPRRSEEKLKLSWPDNYSDEEVTPEAAGITATLFMLNHMAHRLSGAAQERFCNLWEKLQEYMGEHPECGSIAALTD